MLSVLKLQLHFFTFLSVHVRNTTQVPRNNINLSVFSVNQIPNIKKYNEKLIEINKTFCNVHVRRIEDERFCFRLSNQEMNKIFLLEVQIKNILLEK